LAAAAQPLPFGCQLGAADLGLRVFRLDRSNFNIWNGQSVTDEALDKQIEMHIDHLSEASSAEDVLYELLLKAGFQLTTKVAVVAMGRQRGLLD
jgi:adenine-specific DNA-methyltransferase